MAQRRMFSLKIVDTDAFLDMPQSSQLLYFHLAMRADDDGFIPNPKKIMRMLGSQEDDYKVLIVKKFIIPFESGVCVVKHWLIHNFIKSDRYKPTQWIKEMHQLQIDPETKKYRLDSGENILGTQNGPKVVPQDRLGKVSIDKDNTLPPPKKEKFLEKDLELASYLLEKIKINLPNFKQPNLPQWADQIRLMREVDNRTWDEIKLVIEWCQNDHFWQGNILSTGKLRSKFDMLTAQIKRQVMPKSKGSGYVL